MMSPALGNRLPGRRVLGNRQVGRSLHFSLTCFYVVFIVVHVTLVVVTAFRPNMNRITLGTDGTSWVGVGIAGALVGAVVVVNVGANKLSWHRPRLVLHAYQRVVAPVRGALFDRLVPRAGYRPDQISPYFWPNGRPPTSDEYRELRANEFADARLLVHGEVEHAVELSPEELRQLGRSEQITLHDCIQGWSGYAQWAGVPMHALLDLVGPLSGTR